MPAHDILRLLIVGATLVVFAWGRFRGAAAGRPAVAWRRGLLVLLAVAALASYYDFFRSRHYGGTKDGDAFTYYMGSKYFAELGYFGLYECTVAALVEREIETRQELGSAARRLEVPPVRDLRTLEILELGELLKRSHRCPQRFSAQRWRAFKADVEGFYGLTHPDNWPRMLRDHGYNPSPIWTLIGGTLARPTAVGSAGFWLLIHADRALVALTLASIVWAFGLETAALAAVVWGTGHLWSYTWIGDSYLRLLWLAAAVAGLCLARRGRPFSAGVLVALSAMLRLFPAVFALGFLLGAAWRRRRRALPSAFRRFAAGLAAGSLALIAASLLVLGPATALDAYRTFGDKMTVFTATEFSNTVGLSVLTRELGPGAPVLSQALNLAVVALFLLIFWRRFRGLEDWEAAALGFTLIPILSSPANYYYSFVVAAALLASRRPRIAVPLLLSCAAWLAVALLLPQPPLPPRQQVIESVAASLVAVAFCFLVLREMGRPPPSDRSSDRIES